MVECSSLEFSTSKRNYLGRGKKASGYTSSDRDRSGYSMKFTSIIMIQTQKDSGINSYIDTHIYGPHDKQ